MGDFYQKYRQLFEEDDLFYKMKNENMKQPPKKPIEQLYQFNKIQNTPQKESPAQQRQMSQQKSRQDDSRIRNKVMQENIFNYESTPPRQPRRQYVQQNEDQNRQLKIQQAINYQPPEPYRAPEAPKPQQTYKQPEQQQPIQSRQQINIAQDSLDSFTKQQSNTIPKSQADNHIHSVYMNRLNDIDAFRKRFTDVKQLTYNLDPSNPYKHAIQKRILAQLNAGRKNKLREMLK
ncbi:hypothetical protein pb186bvf_005822 [Paramecium bursaria]